MDKYRILSLDGGGTWALLQVMALQKLYGPGEQGYDVLKRFNLVAANGGGSIVLAGLAMNMTLQQVLDDFFVDDRRRRILFGPTEMGWTGAAEKIRLEALRDVFGRYRDHSLGALFGGVRQHTGVSPNFLVCAFDYDRRRPEFFRSNLTSPSASSTGTWDPTLAEVIQASMTSPIEDLKALAKIEGARFCDGSPAGLYNPILAAVTEARAIRRGTSTDIQVLSIGTSTVERPLSKLSAGNGWLRWAKKKKKEPSDFLESVAKTVFAGPSDAPTYIAHVMLEQQLPGPGNPPPIVTGSVVRMNPVIRLAWDQATNGWAPQTGVADNVLKWVAQLEKAAVEKRGIDLVTAFGKLWIGDVVDNEPIRANRDFKCEVGHEKFSKAAAAWRALAGEPALRDTSPAAGAPPAAA